MPRAAYILTGVAVLILVTFFNPMVGNVLGFCPPSEGPKALGIDATVAMIDAAAIWLLYRGWRLSTPHQ